MRAFLYLVAVWVLLSSPALAEDRYPGGSAACTAATSTYTATESDWWGVIEHLGDLPLDLQTATDYHARIVRKHALIVNVWDQDNYMSPFGVNGNDNASQASYITSPTAGKKWTFLAAGLSVNSTLTNDCAVVGYERTDATGGTEGQEIFRFEIGADNPVSGQSIACEVSSLTSGSLEVGGDYCLLIPGTHTAIPASNLFVLRMRAPVAGVCTGSTTRISLEYWIYEEDI